MNRFIIGGILAAIVVGLTSGLGSLFTDRDDQPRLVEQTGIGETDDDLGSLPLEQAGQLVQRQSEVGANGIGTTSDFVGQDPQGMPSGGRPNISPQTTGQPGGAGTTGTTGTTGNVIPRLGEATTFPTTSGDIAPIQPGLVQPGVEQQRPTDPDLDSIPALW